MEFWSPPTELPIFCSHNHRVFYARSDSAHLHFSLFADTEHRSTSISQNSDR